MSQHLSLDRALAVLRSAFNPLRCDARDFEYREKVRIEVFKSQELLCRVVIKAADAQDPDLLKNTIFKTRSYLKTNGFRLDPWTFKG